MKKFLFTLLILFATSFPSYGESINCGSGETYTTLAAAVSHINSSADAINTITITSDLTEATTAAVLTKDNTTIKCDTTLYTVTALDAGSEYTLSDAALTIRASNVVIDNVGFTDTGLDNGVAEGLIYVDLASMTYSGSAIIKNCNFTLGVANRAIKSNYKAGLVYDLDIVNTSIDFAEYLTAIEYDSSGIFRLTNSYLVLTSGVTLTFSLALNRFASGSTVVGNYFNGAGVNNIQVSATAAITDSSILIANNLFSNANLSATKVNREIYIGNGTTQVTVNIVGNLFFDNSTHTGLTSGICVFPKCTANVYNNTFVNKAYGLDLSSADATTTVRMYNNLFYGSRVDDIYTNNTSLVQYTFYNNTFNTNSAKQCDNATVLAALQASTGYSMAVSAMSDATVPTTGLFLLPNSGDNKAVITGSTTLLTNNTYNSVIQLLPRNPVWKTAANTAYPTNTTGVSPVYPTLSAHIPRGAYYNQTLFYIMNKSGEEGNDNGSGLETDPWLTIAKINALTNQQAGDTYSFNKGDTWNEQLTVPASGASGSPITYTSYGSGEEKPVIDGTGVGENKLIITAGETTLTDATDYITFDGLKFTTADDTVVVVNGADNITFQDCDFEDGQEYFIQFTGTNNAITAGTVDGCTFTDWGLQGGNNQDYAIHVTGANNNTSGPIEITDSTFTITHNTARGAENCGGGAGNYPCEIMPVMVEQLGWVKNFLRNTISVSGSGVMFYGSGVSMMEPPATATEINVMHNSISGVDGNGIGFNTMATNNPTMTITVGNNYVYHVATNEYTAIAQADVWNDKHGIYIKSTDSDITTNVYGNLINGTGRTDATNSSYAHNGIYLSTCDSVNVYNNTIYKAGNLNVGAANHYGDGIQFRMAVGEETTNSNAVNNICSDSGQYGFRVSSNAALGATNAVTNNCLYNSGTADARENNADKTAAQLNAVAGCSANISSDPKFKDAALGQFWMKANSPCKKAGLSIAGYNDRLMPTSSWPAGIKTKATQGKTIGAYAAQYSLFPALHIYMKKWD